MTTPLDLKAAEQDLEAAARYGDVPARAAEIHAHLVRAVAEVRTLRAERDKLFNALIYYRPEGDENWEEGDDDWLATFDLPNDPEWKPFATKEEAIDAVRKGYGLDPASLTPSSPVVPPEKRPSLKEACDKLWHKYQDHLEPPHGWLTCILDGGDEIVVCARKKFVPADLPSEVDGYPVRVLRGTGTPIIGGPQDG